MHTYLLFILSVVLYRILRVQPYYRLLRIFYARCPPFSCPTFSITLSTPLLPRHRLTAVDRLLWSRPNCVSFCGLRALLRLVWPRHASYCDPSDRSFVARVWKIISDYNVGYLNVATGDWDTIRTDSMKPQIASKAAN